jgi:hypothetical protein
MPLDTAASEFLGQTRPPRLALLSGARCDIVTLLDDDDIPPGVPEWLRSETASMLFRGTTRMRLPRPRWMRSVARMPASMALPAHRIGNHDAAAGQAQRL